MNDLYYAKEIANKVEKLGGKAYFVGGYVRDKLIREFYDSNCDFNTDIDIEVHGLTSNQLEDVLNQVGDYNSYGKSFGIYSLAGTNLDIALPRTENKIGKKHTDFNIKVDSNLGTKKASKRRDFTINSILEDIITGEYIDHYNGIADIKNGKIRHVDEKTFIEDPLRVFRAAQFSARFNFSIDKTTLDLCSKIDTSYLSKERVFLELEKAFLKANKPSVFFENLKLMDQLALWFKEVQDLEDIKQNPVYHKEGNVYIHTMLVIDEAAKLRQKAKHELEFMLSALCHDFGKVTASEEIDGVIHAYEHEIQGVPLAENFLKKITDNKFIIKYVKNMTKNHMRPNRYAMDNSKIKVTNRMFYESICPNDLILLALADARGSITDEFKHDSKKFLYDRYEIYKEYMSRDYVSGEDLINNGVSPGKNIGKILELALKHRFVGIKKQESLKQCLAYARSLDLAN